MKVLLLGAGGMLARDLAAEAPPEATVVAAARAELDIRDASAVARALDHHRPAVVLNAAAYTAVDRAESERELAFTINGEAVGILGKAAARRGVRVVHFSTDYVFPGDGVRPYQEDDPVNPLNVYGESKLAGEAALLESGAPALILRTQWLFGVHGRSFPRTMHARARAGEPTRVVNDQRGSPTCTVDLARATWQLLGAPAAAGIYHATNAGEATWYDLAHRVFAAEARTELLTPCSTADYPTPARRPAYSVLDGSRLRGAGVAMPPWEEAVDRFLAAAAGNP